MAPRPHRCAEHHPGEHAARDERSATRARTRAAVLLRPFGPRDDRVRRDAAEPRPGPRARDRSRHPAPDVQRVGRGAPFSRDLEPPEPRRQDTPVAWTRSDQTDDPATRALTTT